MNKRILAGVVFVFGAIAWTVAKEVSGNQLGAIPTIIVVAPFIYWSQRLWRAGDVSAASPNEEAHADIESRLELAAANPKLSYEKRAEAKRRLERLRSESIATASRVDDGSTPAPSSDDDLDEPTGETADGTRLPVLNVLVIVILGLAAAGIWYERSDSNSAAKTSLLPSAAPRSPDVTSGVDAPENPSAFVQRTFDGVTISVPKDWRSIGQNDAQSLNTASEALTGIGQGNNTILWAANALDDANIPRATMRLSVRDAVTIGQEDLREAMRQPQEAIERELMTAAEQATAPARKMPQTIYYKVVNAGLRENGNIVCTWMSYEYDIGKGPTVSDIWICPASDRTYKFTTSYTKARAALYAPAIEHSWQSLSVEHDH